MPKRKTTYNSTFTIGGATPFSRKLFDILLLLVFASCGQYTKKQLVDNVDTINKTDSQAVISPTISTILVSLSDFQGKVFDIGSMTHFTDTCAFYFECDCCAGELIFNPNSTFYYKAYCMSDQSVSAGKYSLSNNVLTLYFSGHCVSNTYNYENEMDTSAVDYLMTDTIVSPTTIQYFPTMCNNKIKLIESKNTECAIETGLDYKTVIALLTKDGFIDRFEKMKK